MTIGSGGLGLMFFIGVGSIRCADNGNVYRYAGVTCYAWGQFGIPTAGASYQLKGIATSGACRKSELKRFETSGWLTSFGTGSFDGTNFGASVGIVWGIGKYRCLVTPY